jgi:hypothetical protein
MSRFLTISLFGACSFLIAPLRAQHWVNPDFETHRLDLRDLGYPEINQIPANSSAVTSLRSTAQGRIYGGTMGDEAYLFLYDPKINKVRHLGKLPGAEGIHHALVEDREGLLYIGTGKNIFAELEFTKKTHPGSMGAATSLWADVQRPYASYPGGHLFRYDPRTGDQRVLYPGDPAPVENLGVAVPKNGIYALEIDAGANAIYGVTYPDGRFFSYDISNRRFKDLGEIDSEVFFHGPEREWRSLPRALAVGQDGRVYTSGKDGFLTYYDPKDGGLHLTTARVPGEYYPVQAYSGHPVVEAFAQSPEGLIYGASSDGFVFSFEPRTQKLINLGKPRVSRRIRALALSHVTLYMIAGERIEPCRLFTYDLKGGGFDDLGVLAVDRSPYFSWRGHQFDSMAAGPTGTIYIGESERRSHLFLYLPP